MARAVYLHISRNPVAMPTHGCYQRSVIAPGHAGLPTREYVH